MQSPDDLLMALVMETLVQRVEKTRYPGGWSIAVSACGLSSYREAELSIREQRRLIGAEPNCPRACRTSHCLHAWANDAEEVRVEGSPMKISSSWHLSPFTVDG